MELEYVQTLYFRKLAPEKITITATHHSQKKNIIFAGLSNGTIIGWDLYLPIPVARLVAIAAHSGAVTALSFHHVHGLLVSGGLDQQVRVWDVVFSDLIDVSGVQQLKMEHFLNNDPFYVAHGGTVAPFNTPNDQNQMSRKTVLVQEFAENSRKIVQIKEQGSGFLVLCGDGTFNYFQQLNDFTTKHLIKYPQFHLKDRVYLGLERNDIDRRMDIMDLANKSTKSLSTNASIVKVELDSKAGSQTIRSMESPLLCSKVSPTCCITTRQDGNIFCGDSMGQVHCLSINQDKIQYQYCIGNVHRLQINQMMYLAKENAIITCSQEGTIRSIVSVTGQIYYSFNNQRVKQFIDICCVLREVQLTEEEKADKIKKRKLERDAQLKNQNRLTTVSTPDNNSNDQIHTNLLPPKPSSRGSLKKAGEDVQILANVISSSEMTSGESVSNLQDNLVLAIDSDSQISVIDAAVGNSVAEISFTDIAPNLAIIQQDLEKYNIDTTLPIVCDFRQSKNSSMYAVQKQNTSASDEYKLLKLNYKRQQQQAQSDAFLDHPNLTLFEDSRVVSMFVFNHQVTGQQQVCFVRYNCMDVYSPKFKTRQQDQKIQKPVRLMSLLLMSVQQQNFDENISEQKRKKLEQAEFDDNLKLTLSADRIFKSRSVAGDGRISGFNQYMQQYRLQKVQLGKINEPLQQLRSLSPFMPRDLDSIESFVKNNIDNQGNLPKIDAPNRQGVVDSMTKMSVPFYVLMATEDNIINNFDPRVVRKPYHNYNIDFSTIMNAETIDFQKYTDLNVTYRKLSTQQEGILKTSKIPVGELPKIQPMPNPNNIYSRLTKGTLRNGKEMASLSLRQATNCSSQRESEYRFYHTNAKSIDSQQDLGFYDQDVIYNVVDDGSLKNDINKMDIEVKKVSELPASNCFESIIDTDPKNHRDVLVFGHEDGSLTFQHLLSGHMIRAFGAHSTVITQIVSLQNTSGFQIVSISSDSRLFSVLVPKTNAFRISFLGCCQFPHGIISAACAGNNQVLFADQHGNIYYCQLPLTSLTRFLKIFNGPEFFKKNADKVPVSHTQVIEAQDSPNKPDSPQSRGSKRRKRQQQTQNSGDKLSDFPYSVHTMQIREQKLYVVFENSWCMVFNNLLGDIDQWQSSFAQGAKDTKLYFKSNSNFSTTQEYCSPDYVFKINESDTITTVYIIAPVQNGRKMLVNPNEVKNRVQTELHEAHISLKVDEAQKEKDKKMCRNAKIEGKFINQNANVKLQEFLKEKTEIVKEEDMISMGADQFILVGFKSGVLKVFSSQGEMKQEFKFNDAITGIVGVNRDLIGMRIINQLKEFRGNPDLLKTFWVGMADASVDSDQCGVFLGDE
ncbi:WD40 repeat protein [Spironucleus salmonicida]|uniref:WD40 repeat protein n=1 Tax=Spironucleus salmonicida TaxID=348837 RepID=V6M160_9EUKA|nr:WD40 repeat protein [Spironucleus salmonicida]|eukprot:EST46909.1 hypothetical protein SS50377_13062 [Spironucleus salmonicida]